MNVVQVLQQSGETRLSFEPVLDISHAIQLRAELDRALSSRVPISLDASRVERVDTAAVQLLAVFCRSARDAGLKPRWHATSEAMREATALLGLGDALGEVA
jgi:phospholipid transport system transporter-binding protein